MELIVVPRWPRLLAGFVDSIVGGGGLILVPALFAIFSLQHNQQRLFGTNKGGSRYGARHSQRRAIQPTCATCHGDALLPAASACFTASLAGAWLVTVVPHPISCVNCLPFVLAAGVDSTPWHKKQSGATPSHHGLKA
jgi:uncharacterized membrane protein YfcA